MTLVKTSATWSASTDSAVLDPCAKGPLMAIQTPANFGTTTIALTYCQTIDGTFVPVRNEAGQDIAISGIDPVNAAIYDLSNICALGVGATVGRGGGFFKLKAGASITATAQVFVLEVM